MTSPSQTAALEAIDVSKRFGDFVALENVSLRVRKHTVHALLGENGAGKSTLVKGIMGYHALDGGKVLVDGSPVKARNPREAAAFGIGMVYQHFTVVDNLTVTENLVLSRREHPFVFDWKAEEERVRAFMEKMPFRLDPRRPVRMLAAGEKQKLEILKQLYLETKIMILDEPTSVLTPDEADDVLGLLHRMTADGLLTVVMITHKFREVMGFADDVTVLRRGAMAGSGMVKDLTPQSMAEMMVGQAPARASTDKTAHEGPRKIVLEMRGLCANDDVGTPALSELNLDVRAGEIVGIAGVSGNGQGQLVEVLAGQRTATDGYVKVNGAIYEAERSQMREHGVRCLPDEPLKNACVGSMSVAENMALRRYDRSPFAWARTLVKKRAMRREARALVREYGIRTKSEDAPISSLSGGNVQRAVLARELLGGAQLLIASNPCFGLDFAAVAEIRTRIVQARNQGTAVLLISADLEEILALSDRVLVISEGKIVHETPIEKAEMSVIGKHMAGHH
jgi:general nucleoside transport system ATP-binding protein